MVERIGSYLGTSFPLFHVPPPDTLDLATLVVFLRRGRHPSLPLLLLGIAPVSTIREPRSVGYSYMSR